MLFVVLLLVLTAFGLLITALVTANTVWAWLSVGVSVLGAALLLIDWIGGRRKAAEQPTEEPAETRDTEPDVPAVQSISPGHEPVEQHEPEPAAEPATAQAAVATVTEEQPAPLDEDDPEEEATDAADLLVVTGLSVEVRVVDEHPRYHLARCGWLTGRETIPLPVSEARELGFTPCARCEPDAVLAAVYREES